MSEGARKLASAIGRNISKVKGGYDCAENVDEMIDAAVAPLVSALEGAIECWGDYVPQPNSKAANALHDAKKALEQWRTGR